MGKSSARSVIRLRGVRHNNLKNFDLDLPINQLIVVTGLSGSGKSSLAFDTLFAEGQRRYIETFSPYARQFFDRMDKPKVDSIEGIPPAIAIEQRNSVKTTRSTVGTMTEICDYLKILWPELAELHCRQCDRLVIKESPQAVWQAVMATKCSLAPAREQAPPAEFELLVTFDLPLTEKLSPQESLALVAKQGYQRLLVSGKILRLEEALSEFQKKNGRPQSLTVIQDRLKCSPENRARFVEACEQAYHFGKGKLAIWESPGPAPARNPRFFSNRLHCADCDIEYREPSPALFSFNHPVGACPKCRGFGRIISIDYQRALPDRTKTLAQGVVRPWQTGTGMESQTDMLRMCRHYEIPTDVPFEKLSKKWQELIIEGEPDYGKDEEHEWPRAWYGVKGYFRWLESKAYKMHVRVLLSRYRAYTTCPDCGGTRFQPETLLYRLPAVPQGATAGNGGTERTGRMPGLRLPDFYALPLRDALLVIEQLAGEQGRATNDAFMLALKEVRLRLEYLNNVGLGYLSLDRPTRSLSGGETERVNLTTCLGTRLVNTLYVLDEPSVGLHPRDTSRLVEILEQLRNAGNTVLVVEHEASVMRAADQIVDLGPGHGATGGQVVFQGAYRQILDCAGSLTGAYLSGRKRIETPVRRPVRLAKPAGTGGADSRNHYDAEALREAARPFGKAPAETPVLKISHATRHNLNDLTVQIPLSRFVCISGVSGSGKTTLVREVLLPALLEKFKTNVVELKASERLGEEFNREEEEDKDGNNPEGPALEGSQELDCVALVDQSILGKTPRSNPAVYIGAFDDIRELFARSEQAKRRGLNASAFSFNSSQGQCQRCRGAGFEKIEMQFLSDVFIRCPDCDGRRYRDQILEVKISAEKPASFPATTPAQAASKAARNRRGAPLSAKIRAWSIADVLEATVEEVNDFLAQFPDSGAARSALASLKLLEEVGLGYLRLGQPINTLSGGESQRLKLVRHLAESVAVKQSEAKSVERDLSRPNRTLFIFDEPTTGLHFEDVRLLLQVFQRLVDEGHSVLVIEHNLDVLRSADWIIDLGPEAGDQGGKVVAQGTPEDLMECPGSHTGRALRESMTISRPPNHEEAVNGGKLVPRSGRGRMEIKDVRQQ